MVIDCRRFFQGDGTEEPVNVSLDFSGVELGGVKPFCAPVEVRARFRGFAGAVSFQADVEYTLSMPCDRCAEPVTRAYAKAFEHTLVRELEGEEDDGELILIPDEKLDLDQLVLEDVLLELPGQFLCREDCKGLCPTCGKNWNQGPCQCGGPKVDPRLAVLKDLL